MGIQAFPIFLFCKFFIASSDIFSLDFVKFFIPYLLQAIFVFAKILKMFDVFPNIYVKRAVFGCTRAQMHHIFIAIRSILTFRNIFQILEARDARIGKPGKPSGLPQFGSLSCL